MKYISTQASFKSGRLSEKLHGRVDVREYSEGLSVAKNSFISKSGGAYKRFGINNLMDLPVIWTGDAKLVSYTLYEIHTLNIAMTNTGYIIFNEDGNPITDFVSWGGILEPQFFDTSLYENKIFITHYSGIMKPFVIEVGLDSTYLKPYVSYQGPIPTGFPNNVPLKDWNLDTGIKFRILDMLTPPTQQIQSNVPYFDSTMVGEWIMIRGITRRYFAENAGIDRNELVSNLYRIESVVSDTLVNVTASNSYIFSSGVGVADIFTSYGKTDASLYPYAASSTSNYYSDWTMSAWNVRDGWPRTVSVDEGRLIFGGTPAKPNTFYGSNIGDPFFFMDKRFMQYVDSNYYGDIIETDPYQFTIASDNDSSITFMQPASSFIMGTLRREYIVSGNSGTVSKKNISVRPHTAHGSTPLLTAVYDTNVFYVGTSGKQLFLLRYSEENGSFLSKEVSVLFDDLLDEDGVVIKDLDWNEKLGILFVVLSNGKMITVTVNNETGTMAATEVVLEGIEIISTSYTSFPHATRQMFLYRMQGRIFLGELTDELGIVGVSEADDANIPLRLKHGDLVKEYIATFKPIPVNYISESEDFIYTRETDFIAGDEVTFSQLGPGTTIGTSNINKSQTYYAIPYKSGITSSIGIRLAETYADAIANNYMDITQVITKTAHNDEANITLNHQKQVRYLPLKQFPEGALIQIFKVENNGDEVEVIEYTKVFGDEVYDLGSAHIYAGYGIGFEFHIATMPIEAGQQWGSSQLGLKRPDKVSVRYYRTYSFLIGTDGYNEEEVIVDDYSSGRHEVAITANSEYDSIIHIRNTKIEPCYIINMTIRGLSNDG